MSHSIKLPKGFEPPIEVITENYIMEPLTPKHNEMDYEAWTSSKEELKDIFGPRDGWPGEVTSIEYNLRDLEKDYKEFKDRKTFRYIILNTDRASSIGCFYIRPTSAVDYDCRVDFWFRNSHKYLEPLFFEEVKKWLKNEWKFQNPAYPGRSMTWDEYYRLID